LQLESSPLPAYEYRLKLDSLAIDAARSAVQERKVTATPLAEELYTEIQKDDPRIGSYLILSKDRALEQAGRMDQLVSRGEKLPPLGGVTIGIKDVLTTRGVRTTAGSKILGNYIPPCDCTAVSRLEAAGAVFLGKTNCDESALGSSSENTASHHGPHPRDTYPGAGG